MDKIMIDLLEKKPELIILAEGWFNTITNLPKNIRDDGKFRPGISIYAGIPGTRNFFSASIKEPSEAAKVFAVEKAVRSNLLGHASSQNSQDPDKMRFAGSVTICIDGLEIQFSTSGLSAQEDTLVSTMGLAKIFKLSPFQAIECIQKMGGKLPDEFFDVNHYLHHFVNSLRVEDSNSPLD